MEILGALTLIIVGLLAGGAATWQYFMAHRTEREAALDAELKALRTSQRLSMAAWQARQAMRINGPIDVDSYDITDHEGGH